MRPADHCPRCRAVTVSPMPPMPMLPGRWKCASCGHEWEQDDGMGLAMGIDLGLV